MPLLNVPASLLLEIASQMNGTSHQTEAEQRQAYGPTFGATPESHSILWSHLREHCPELFVKRRSMSPKKLLWALAKLMVFKGERVMCGIVSIDGKAPCSKSYRDWTWDIIAAIHDLTAYVVSFRACICIFYIVHANVHGRVF
jgi:hypothetical protein